MTDAERKLGVIGKKWRALAIMIQMRMFLVKQTAQNIICQRSLTLALAAGPLGQRLNEPTGIGHA